MSSTDRAAHELTQILTDYCKSYGAMCLDIERVRNLLGKVSHDQRCELLAAIIQSDGYKVLIAAAWRGHVRHSALISTIS